MTYTYDCRNCGRVELSRPVDERKKTRCQCGATVKRVPDDFSPNMLPAPFKAISVFGRGGNEHREITSVAERDAACRHSYWEEDYEMGAGPHRELMEIEEFGKEWEFDERRKQKETR